MGLTEWPASGHPTRGNASLVLPPGPLRVWEAGDIVLDTDGVFWRCTARGRPGTWERVPASEASAPSELTWLDEDTRTAKRGVYSGVTQSAADGIRAHNFGYTLDGDADRYDNTNGGLALLLPGFYCVDVETVWASSAAGERCQFVYFFNNDIDEAGLVSAYVPAAMLADGEDLALRTFVLVGPDDTSGAASGPFTGYVSAWQNSGGALNVTPSITCTPWALPADQL